MFYYLFAAFKIIQAGANRSDKLSMDFGFADSDFQHLKWYKYLARYYILVYSSTTTKVIWYTFIL